MAALLVPVHGLRAGWRRHLSLLVSGGLVVVMGALGLYAGQAAGDLAVEVHREDRTQLQKTLAGLTDTYVRLTLAEVAGHLERGAVAGPWSAAPGDPTTAARLQGAVEGTRSLDAGALLLSAAGVPLAAWSAGVELPAQDDPGWEPLRTAVGRRDGSLPLSGVLSAGTTPLLAMGLPVPLSDGSTGMLVGLWDAAAGGLQEYVAGLTYGETGRGYVVDGAGLVLAGTSVEGGAEVLGRPLPLPEVRAALRPGSGVLDTDEADGRSYVTSFADAGRTGWTAVTAQDADEFEGALRRSSRLVELVVVALLLVAGTGLVVLHRKREAALRAVALRDELTGVYNRRGWFTLAGHELERARRAQQSRVLVFVDVDGLKQVNDVLGHREGDRAVRDAAAVLTAASRGSDVVGRLGGDEFVVLLGEGGEPDVAARRVREALAAHNAASGAGFELRLSIGVEVWEHDAPCTVDELVRRADAVMYVDKAARPDRGVGVLRLPVQRSEAGERSAV